MHRVRSAMLTVALASLAAATFAATADAGELMEEPQVGAPLTITKVVSGPVPGGTTFTVTVECDEPTIYDGDETGLTSATVTFDATGAPTSDNVISFFGGNQCSVTETATGGASTVSYACAGEIPERQMEPPEDPNGVGAQGIEELTDPCLSVTAAGVEVAIEDEDQFATVTITNAFVAEPADAIVARPAFTG